MGRDGSRDPRVGWQVRIGQVIMERGKEKGGALFYISGVNDGCRAVFLLDG